MKRIITSIFILFSVAVFAQEGANDPLKLGFKGGLSIPNLSASTDNIYTMNFESFTSFEAGAFINHSFNDLVSLQVELNYTVKGGERSGDQPVPVSQLPPGLPLPPGAVVYADFTNKSVLEYIEIPVLAKFTFGESDWKFFGNIGPYAGFLIGATNKTSGSSELTADIPGVGVVPVGAGTIPFNAETDVKDDIKDFNFGGIVGIGVIKELGNMSELFFEVRGTYGFIPIQEDEIYGKSNIGSFVFSFGYAFKL